MNETTLAHSTTPPLPPDVVRKTAENTAKPSTASPEADFRPQLCVTVTTIFQPIKQNGCEADRLCRPQTKSLKPNKPSTKE